MNDDTDGLMVEATRLTRAGRLAEATALIQRSLGRAHRQSGNTADPASESRSIDVAFEVVADPVTAVETPAFEASSAVAGAATETQAAPASAAPARPKIHGKGSGQAATLPLRTSPGGLRPGVLPGRSGRGVARRPISPDAVAPAVGRWIDGTYTNPAGTRAYKLYVPSGYHEKPVPLIVMLHGCTQFPDDFAAGTGMNFLAEADDFLVVYPAQDQAANASRCWNWFQDADQRRDQGEPSLIAGITRQVMAEYHVDPHRVHVAGLSAGGAMAAIMATTYPDLYAALGVHSGLAPGSAHDLPSAFQAMQHGAPAQAPRSGRVIPLILFHGDHDSTVHPCNADHIVRHWANTAPTVTARRRQKPAGRDATCAIYPTANRRSLVEQWTVLGAGHAWSGGSNMGSYTDPDGPDASREIVRFFREHPAAKDHTATSSSPGIDS